MTFTEEEWVYCGFGLVVTRGCNDSDAGAVESDEVDNNTLEEETFDTDGLFSWWCTTFDGDWD